MELPDKEKLKGIDPTAKFICWGKLTLTSKDMTNSSCRKHYEISSGFKIFCHMLKLILLKFDLTNNFVVWNKM